MSEADLYIEESYEPARPRIVIRDAAYALQPQPPIDWIIEPLFFAGSLSLLVGHGGAKKTRAMISALIRVALGAKWITYNTKQSTVLFIDEESGETHFARMLGEALRGELGDEKTPVKFISLARFNLMKDDADALILQANIEQTGARLVVIDALADIMPGGDENAVKDVHPVFMRLRKIAVETGAAIIVIHHANRAGDYRGSSAMKGAVDLMIQVESASGSMIVKFETSKARYTEPIRFAAMIHFDQDMTWLSPIEPVDKEKKRTAGEEYVIRILTERGPMTIEDIQTNANVCSERTAYNAVYKLAQEGVIERSNFLEGAGGRGKKAIYQIRARESLSPENKE